VQHNYLFVVFVFQRRKYLNLNISNNIYRTFYITSDKTKICIIPYAFHPTIMVFCSVVHTLAPSTNETNLNGLQCKKKIVFLHSFTATATTTAVVGSGGGSSNQGSSTAPAGTRFWPLPASFPLPSSPSLLPPAGWWRGRPSSAGT
jgi:hypothetical protein